MHKNNKITRHYANNVDYTTKKDFCQNIGKCVLKPEFFKLC